VIVIEDGTITGEGSFDDLAETHPFLIGAT
jgi:hypothetical protein